MLGAVIKIIALVKTLCAILLENAEGGNAVEWDTFGSATTCIG